MFVVEAADPPSGRAVCSPELCSSDQRDHSFRAYDVFIEAMSPRSGVRGLPLGKKTLEYEAYHQQADTEIA
jgi:hypothetical protein